MKKILVVFFYFLIKQAISINSFSQKFLSSQWKTDFKLPIIKDEYTIEGFPCIFPFKFQNQIFFDCAPEFRMLQNNKQKILLYWCFYQDPNEPILKKGYCKDNNSFSLSNSQFNNQSFSFSHEEVLTKEQEIQEAYKQGLLAMLEKTNYFLINDTKSNFSQCNNDLNCIEKFVNFLFSKGNFNKTSEKQFISQIDSLNKERNEKEAFWRNIKDFYSQFIFLNDSISNEGLIYTIKEYKDRFPKKRYKAFINSLKVAEAGCDMRCIDYFEREILRSFTKTEIKRIKKEVFCQLQGFNNLSNILEEESRILLNKEENIADNFDLIEDIKFHFSFWTDKTLILKILNLLFKRPIKLEDLLKEYHPNFLWNYEELELLLENYRYRVHNISGIFEKEVDSLGFKTNQFLSQIQQKIQEIENLTKYLRDFNDSLKNLSNSLLKVANLNQNIKTQERETQEKTQFLSLNRTSYYAQADLMEENYYKDLLITSNFHQCNGGLNILYEAFYSSRLLKGPKKKGYIVEPLFFMDSIGPSSLRISFTFNSDIEGKIYFVIEGSNDDIILLLDNSIVNISTISDSMIVSNEIDLKIGKLYQIVVEISRKIQNFGKKYEIFFYYREKKDLENKYFSPINLCFLPHTYTISCQKTCKNHFNACFLKDLWSFEQCVKVCEIYDWNAANLLCLKNFIQNNKFCEDPQSMAKIFNFCHLTGNFVLEKILLANFSSFFNFIPEFRIPAVLYDEKEAHDNLESLFVETLQKNAKSNKFLGFSSANHEYYLFFDRIYLFFKSKIMKIYPIKSHLKENKPFLYYPPSKNPRKSVFFTVFSPNFSENEFNSDTFLEKIEENILFCENFPGNTSLLVSKNFGLLYFSNYFPTFEKPKISANYLSDYFFIGSQVFIDLFDIYFVKIPFYLQEFFLIKVPGYPKEILSITSWETLDVILAIENIGGEEISDDDLDFIEDLASKGWRLVEESFKEDNLLIIGDSPNIKQNMSLKQCFWEDFTSNSICKDYEIDTQTSFQEKKFVLWSKTLSYGETITINNGISQMIPFVKPINRKGNEDLCSEGDNNWIEINQNFDNVNSSPFIEIATNLNDCVWILDENGQVSYRKGVTQIDLSGKL